MYRLVLDHFGIVAGAVIAEGRTMSVGHLVILPLHLLVILI